MGLDEEGIKELQDDFGLIFFMVKSLKCDRDVSIKLDVLRLT